MADKNGFSEIIAEILIELQKHSVELQKHSSVLRSVVDVQERMLTMQEQMQQTQEAILDRLDRNEAGFNAFAGAALDHLGEIRADLRNIRTTVYQDHGERLRRLEDFMRRAS
jgi:hypothetical protein